MRNRLPLPLATIKALILIRDAEYRSDIGLNNMVRNCLRELIEYDYQDAIKTLGFIKQDYPDLLDYAKHIKLIQQAEKRYNAI